MSRSGSFSSATHTETSTELYCQEAHSTYQTRVLGLAQKVWPNVCADDIIIERLSGGDYNRIVGFTIRGEIEDLPIRYILRVPRWLQEENCLEKARETANEVALLQFVGQNTTIPIPKVVKYDCKIDNPVGNQYTIQERVQGRAILYAYPEMPHFTRCAVARQLGEVIDQLVALQSNRIGSIIPSDPSLPQSLQNSRFSIETVQNTGPVAKTPYNGGFTAKKTLQYVLDMLKYRYEMEVARDDTFRAEYTAEFLKMLTEMLEAEALSDMPISLCHLDFEPRNILADAENELQPISAVLDWDSAIFAPAIMICRPPMWLWAWSDDVEDEREANDTPTTPQGRQIKRIFERAAGPIYAQLAYGTPNRLARRLIEFAMYGLNSTEQMREADKMLKEWSERQTQIRNLQ